MKSFSTGVLHQGELNETNTATFNVVFDQKTDAKVRLNYQDVSKAELFIYDTKNTLLYDSGLIKSPN